MGDIITVTAGYECHDAVRIRISAAQSSGAASSTRQARSAPDRRASAVEVEVRRGMERNAPGSEGVTGPARDGGGR